MWTETNQHADVLFKSIGEMRDLGIGKTIGIMTLNMDHMDAALTKRLVNEGVDTLLCVAEDEPAFEPADGMKYYTVANGTKAVEAVDAFVIYDPFYWHCFQRVGTTTALNRAVSEKDVPIVPFNRNAERYPLLPSDYLEGRSVDEVRSDSVIWQYARRSGLEGGYAEFGTWFGRMFNKNMLLFKDLFKGDFHAFDSFGGLPKPRPDEEAYSANDFIEGRYFCNEASFRAISNFSFNEADLDKRIKITKGFYSDTLDGHTIADYGIKERSISFCVIDCDLYDGTKSVLEFITPALQDGAILYFDDYRLGRAARKASEYHAMREWLRDNPDFDVLDLHRDHWQHQYLIFNRLWDGDAPGQ